MQAPHGTKGTLPHVCDSATGPESSHAPRQGRGESADSPGGLAHVCGSSGAGEPASVASTPTLPPMPSPEGAASSFGADARERGASTASSFEGSGTSSVHEIPQRDKCSARQGKSADELLFLEALDHESEAWREDRAEHHERIAKLAELTGHPTRADWHRARASGLRWRYRNACRCGLDTLHKLCGACGVVHSTPKGCKRYTVCGECRAGRAAARAKRLGEGMQRHARTPEARMGAAEGWRWRWLTLTVPHGAGVVEDASRLPRAWSRLRRRIRQRLGPARASWLRYVRSLELTASDGGHAHLHVLVWSPWLSQAWLAVEWARAVRAEGGRVDERALVELVERERSRRGEREAASLVELVTDGRARRAPASVPWAVVDVRRVGDDGDALRAYAAKGVALYAAKGAHVEGGAFALAAELERALYSRRTWQASPGLCTAPEPLCADCGARAWRGEIERSSLVGSWWTGWLDVTQGGHV